MGKWIVLVVMAVIVYSCYTAMDLADQREATTSTNTESRAPASRTNAPPKPMPRPTGSWQVVESINPVDDSKSVQLVLEGDAASKWGNSIRLNIRCLSNKTELFVNWHEFVNNEATPVLHRIDSNPAETSAWGISTDYQTTFYSRSIGFIKKLINAEKLLLQTTPHGENPKQVTFRLSGLSEAIKPVRATCNW